jgi:hypothetical protein
MYIQKIDTLKTTNDLNMSAITEIKNNNILVHLQNGKG